MSEISLSTNETRKIVAESDETGDYEIRAEGNPVALATRKQDAIESDDRILEAGRPAKLTKSERGEAIYAHAPDGDVTLRVSKTRFALVKYAPQKSISIDTVESLETIQGNRDGIATLSQDVSASTNLSPLAVPDGFALLVRADPGNDDTVLVDGSFPLTAGDSLELRVSDASQVSVSPASGTQTVHAVVEAQ